MISVFLFEAFVTFWRLLVQVFVVLTPCESLTSFEESEVPEEPYVDNKLEPCVGGSVGDLVDMQGGATQDWGGINGLVRSRAGVACVAHRGGSSYSQMDPSVDVSWSRGAQDSN